MVQALPQRLRELNADPRYLHRVTRAAVFGSFLTDKPVLGDVDFAIDYELRVVPRPPGSKEEFARHFPPPEYIERDFMRSLFWDEDKFVRDMRVGNGMRVHQFSELELLGCPYRVIFEAETAQS